MSGGKGAKAPDYGPLAAASKEAAQIMAGLGREQLDFAKFQYGDVSPQLKAIAQGQADAQTEQLRQARDYYDYAASTYRPLEQGIVRDAERFNTADYRQQLARQAAADTGLAFTQNQQALARNMAAMGVNPNSGKFAAQANQNAVGLAAARAGAMNASRIQSEQMGYARRLDAAGLGRNLPGFSAAAYQGATIAGNAAGQSLQSAGQNYIGNMAIGSGTIAQGHQMQLQGLSNVLNAQTQAYINNQGGGIGDVLGGVAGLAGAGLKIWSATSDRRAKENIQRVGTDERTGLPLYSFNYVWNPDRTWIGVMADDVEKKFPEAVIDAEPYRLVDYGKLGIEMREVV